MKKNDTALTWAKEIKGYLVRTYGKVLTGEVLLSDRSPEGKDFQSKVNCLAGQLANAGVTTRLYAESVDQAITIFRYLDKVI